MLHPFPILLIGLAILGLTLILFRPDSGFIWRRQQQRRLTRRVLREDILKHIYSFALNGAPPSPNTIADKVRISPEKAANLVAELQTAGYLQAGERLALTPAGQTLALHIIRAHRLWEHHLAEKSGVPEPEWHEEADRQEHLLSMSDLASLAEQLGYPTHDPHGDPIPSDTGLFITPDGQPLDKVQAEGPLRIVHLEDEPAIIYAQLVASGLYPGMIIDVRSSSPERIRFWADGVERVLAPQLAANVSVVPLKTAVEIEPVDSQPLTCLQPGQTAEVVAISPTCRGLERRRFMDLGILRGTAITAEFPSPARDPVAYRIRGALIALRREQAAQIKIRRLSS